MEKIKVMADSPDPNDETAHLRPVIEFLKTSGNAPKDDRGFVFDKGGYGELRWKKAFNKEKILECFSFPGSIYFHPSGEIYDERNALYLIPGTDE